MGSKNLIRIINTQVFIIKETTEGEALKPAAGDVVIPVGLLTMNQQPTFTPSDEITGTRSLCDDAPDMIPPGEMSLATYLHPSGVAGTPPVEDILLQAYAGDGSQTIVGGVSVSYALKNEQFSVTVWWKADDDVVHFAEGCVIKTRSAKFNSKGFLGFDWGGTFRRLGTLGKMTADAAYLTGVSVIGVNEIDLATLRGPILIGATSHIITAVDRDNDQITISPALAADVALDDPITPDMPTWAKPTQQALRALNGRVSIDAVNIAKFRELSIEASDNTEYVADEITSDGYASDYAEDMRAVSGTLGLTYRKADAQYFNRGLVDEFRALAVVFDEGGGSKYTMTLPKSRIPVPEVSDAKPVAQLSIPITALGNAGNDEFTDLFE